ncbi:hypothetical protein [Glycomyces algeriensis]|uniref:Peptidase inhibitor family I36 n=1 Tax=Glycomyces algeriensis TaxID=256037 RepID=A0A9W6LF46_9ACTN|nr:hypothetical protein [Glycomyces algeriensis]MDA1368724.1 hypothetical protein [Glycomyces algeriensis]MDR7352503.1 hypothetical protein [Glycomyces algeriensis]GLI40186.1 hypothetical protein GALLR39Z86_00360 [Glycomyces algeriensis]
MSQTLKGRIRTASATIAALTLALTGFAVFGTATAASSQPVDDAAVTSAEDAGILGIPCETGTGWNGDNPTSQMYAWASCDEPGSDDINLWAFRVKYSCTSESYFRYSYWYRADGRTIRGYCPRGKRVDISSVETLYNGGLDAAGTLDGTR